MTDSRSASCLTTGLAQLVGAVGETLDVADLTNGRPTTSTFGDLRTAMKQALDDPGLVPAALLSSPALPFTGVGKYLLHRCPSFVLFATVTAPRCVLAPHDHGSWGLVGLYRGVEEETSYVPLEISGSSGTVGLAEARRAVYTHGDISLISPPTVDVHRLVNLGDEPSITIHLFGDDVVAKGFHTYAPVHVRTATGALDYDRIPDSPVE